MKRSLLVNSGWLVVALAACSQIPPKAYYDRGNPESLIDTSTETVTLGLTSRQSITELSDIIAKDPPARVILSCHGGGLCADAKAMLDKKGMASEWSSGSRNGVTLVYERIIARDCENRYIDNSINPYNLHHPTFGCSIAANMVQMVGDRRQFSNPNLLDFGDGEKGVQTYREYLKPPAKDKETSGSSVEGITIGGGSGLR